MNNKIIMTIFFAANIVLLILVATALIRQDSGVQEEWVKSYQCANYAVLYEMNESSYNCRLEPCQRIMTKPTDVDKCTCTKNNETVYRYCTAYIPVYDIEKEDVLKNLKEGEIEESNDNNNSLLRTIVGTAGPVSN